MEFNARTRRHEERRLRANSKSRVFIWPKNESVMDNLVNRRDRPHDAWKRFAEKAAALFDVQADKISWSQKAGCACGCSPGFVIHGDRPGFDIHVTIEN